MAKIVVSKISPQQVLHKDVTTELLKKYKAKEMTLPEIKQYAYEQIKWVYNTLFNTMKADFESKGWPVLHKGDIVDRTYFEIVLNNLASTNINTYGCFNYLKQNDILGVCGSGYIFEVESL